MKSHIQKTSEANEDPHSENFSFVPKLKSIARITGAHRFNKDQTKTRQVFLLCFPHGYR
jgi:hypothetical protein